MDDYGSGLPIRKLTGFKDYAPSLQLKMVIVLDT